MRTARLGDRPTARSSWRRDFGSAVGPRPVQAQGGPLLEPDVGGAPDPVGGEPDGAFEFEPLPMLG